MTLDSEKPPELAQTVIGKSVNNSTVCFGETSAGATGEQYMNLIVENTTGVGPSDTSVQKNMISNRIHGKKWV